MHYLNLLDEGDRLLAFDRIKLNTIGAGHTNLHDSMHQRPASRQDIGCASCGACRMIIQPCASLHVNIQKGHSADGTCGFNHAFMLIHTHGRYA